MDGYTRLAALIGEQPQYAIFRRFMTLRALRLVHLSADIAQLSDELGLAIEVDRKSGDPERVLFEFYYLRLQKSRQQHEYSAQAEIWDRLDAKLKEHGEPLAPASRRNSLTPPPGQALQMYRSLLSLPDADSQHLDTLQTWLNDDDGGHRFFHGAEAFIWDNEFRTDLTSLSIKDIEQKDSFTIFIQNRVIPLYHSLVGQRHKSPLKVKDPFTGVTQEMPIYSYSDQAIMVSVKTIITAVSSLVPALSMLTLYFIDDPLNRMGAILGLTFLFSMTLTLFTRATTVECFAVSAAFSAVLVVFVGNNGPSNSSYSKS